jgi:hypothetical protein
LGDCADGSTRVLRDEFPSASEADLEGARVVRVALWLTSVYLSFGFDLLAIWLLSTFFQLILLRRTCSTLSNVSRCR